MIKEEQWQPVWVSQWEKDGFKQPTEIQEAFFDALKEKDSVIGISPTGSGKTLAYLLPLMNRIEQGAGNQLLVILPSQELASQVAKVARVWAQPLSLNVQTVLGGANVKRQLERLKKRPEIIVGTPGRLLELIKTKKIKAHLIQAIVLDEVDDLIQDTEFNATKGILKSVLADTQIVAVSATGQAILPIKEEIFREEPRVIDVTETDTSKGTIHHGYIMTPARKRTEILRRLANISEFKGLVFFNQVSELGVVSDRLSYLGIEHQTLASDQHQVTRKAAIEQFDSGKVPLLLTTDLGARGLDFKELDYVIQYDVSQSKEVYIHRAGRVGRMGKDGTVITLVNDSDKKEQERIIRALNVTWEEYFAVHGKLLREKPEVSETETTKEITGVKKSEQMTTYEKKREKPSVSQPKKAKKKNRTKRMKNKGAKWLD